VESPDVPTTLLRLAETLVVLAAPAAAQIQWSAAHGCSDELALDFGWAGGWTVPLIDRADPRLINHRLRDLLGAIDDQLNRMSGHHNTDRWTDDAIKIDPGWRDIRAMANEAIQEIESLNIIAIPPGPNQAQDPTP
jgi:hypothetical protein